jgi:hypothetical protein
VELRTLDQLLRESEKLVQRLGEAPNSTPLQAGKGASVKHLANMNLGQTLWHIGAMLDQSRTKITFTTSWPIKMIGRLLRQHFLSKGFAIPYRHTPANDALLVPPPETTAWEGLAKLKESVANFQASNRRDESPLLGKLSLADWDRLQLRHAEWHLGFMLPD